MDEDESDMSDAAGGKLLAGRILVSLFLYFAAVAHLTRYAQMRGYFQSVGFPLPIMAGIYPGCALAPGRRRVHPMQRQTQVQLLFRKLMFLSMAIALFAVFAGLAGSVHFTVTDPLFHF